MASILVTDGEQRSALAAVRSLGRAGHRVVVTSTRGRSLAGGSRYATAETNLPDPLADPERYRDTLIELVASTGVDLVLPVTDPSMLAALSVRNRLGDAVVPFGGLATFRALSDKQRVGEAARSVGLRVPSQWVLEGGGDSVPDEVSGELVVKPARSVTDDDGDRHKHTVQHVSGRAELREALDALPPTAYPVLVQERIRGPGVGVFLLRWNGSTVAVFAHRRLREKPPSGGVSVYRESVRVDPRLVRDSEALLDEFDWSGVAMVEYKLDAESGTAYVMEVNARLWGSLQLAVDAGVDFPRLLVDAALGKKLPSSPPDYRAGIRSRWWWGDVDHLLARLRGQAPGDAPDDRPRRLEALGDFLVPWRPGDRPEVLRAADPLPFVRETASWFMSALGDGDAGPQ